MSAATDYRPLDLSKHFNGGVDVLETARETSTGTYLEEHPPMPPLGEHLLHGLPFAFADDPERCLIALESGVGEVAIEVDTAPCNVIFAHAVISTDLWEGGELGVKVASYRFHFADGSMIDAPIRERFEIGHMPTPWGQYPFLAVTDEEDHVQPREGGEWNRFGFRMTEVGWAVARSYYLWAWRNPMTDSGLTRIEVSDVRVPFVMGAITLGFLDEDPLRPSARVPVRARLGRDDAGDTEIRVDRGSATYTYPLHEPDENQGFPGFGAPDRPTTAVYAEVSAIPSATVSVVTGEKMLASTTWAELTNSEHVAVENSGIQIVEHGRNWVRVTVEDAATGEPIPCRLSFVSESGVPYPPHGHHAPVFSNLEGWNVDVGGDVRLGTTSYAVIDGRCEGWLPRGKVLVDAARGFEYEPLRQWIEIEPGQTELRLQLRRWANMAAQGWWSGDSHVHFLSPQGALGEARAEDLHVVNLLQAQWGHLFTNVEDFTGEPLASPDGRTVVHVSQENRQHILGHLGLLGLRRPVMPFSSGGPTEAELGGSLETTLSRWADSAHAVGGTVVASHLPTPNGEPATLIATGRVDALEMLDFLDYEHREYYRYLNGGYRLPLVAGTDKMANTTPVGLYRTYAFIPPGTEFSYEAWLAAVRAGNTFISGGALLEFEVEGRIAGETVHIQGGGTVEVTVRASSVFRLGSLQLVREGVVVDEAEAGQEGAHSLELKSQVRVEADTWLAARCAGPGYTPIRHNDDRRRSVMGHSSPVYIATGDSYRVFHPETARYMLTLVEGSLEHIRRRSRNYPEGWATHHHGDTDHQAFLEAPFHEARAALLERLRHEGGTNARS